LEVESEAGPAHEVESEPEANLEGEVESEAEADLEGEAKADPELEDDVEDILMNESALENDAPVREDDE
jgi:hypothetical protein